MIDQPMEREQVEIDPRRMSPARRARIIARDHGHCTYPACDIATGLEVDHVICLALGGKDRDDNLATLCCDHHKAKTRLDRKLIAKAERLRKATFERQPGAVKRNGFRRHPTMKRTVSGQVVERDR